VKAGGLRVQDQPGLHSKKERKKKKKAKFEYVWETILLAVVCGNCLRPGIMKVFTGPHQP
jgi:hypothetical protein